MSADVYAELHLWNKNAAALIRVLQRIDAFSVLPKQTLKTDEVRLKEVRAAVNSDVLKTLLMPESVDQSRLNRLRNAWEQAASRENSAIGPKSARDLTKPREKTEKLHRQELFALL